MDILNFRDLKIKRNTMRALPNPQLKFKIYAQICIALGKFALLQASILLAGLQQIGLFALAGATDI